MAVGDGGAERLGVGALALGAVAETAALDVIAALGGAADPFVAVAPAHAEATRLTAMATATERVIDRIGSAPYDSRRI